MGAVGLAVAVPGWIAWAQIQTVDEIVTTARQEAALPPGGGEDDSRVHPESHSPRGTYWLLQTDTPPLPFIPFPN